MPYPIERSVVLGALIRPFLSAKHNIRPRFESLRLTLRAGAEFALIAAILTVFLAVYVRRFGEEATAVVPHIALISTLWGAWVTLRLLVCSAVRSDRLVRWLNAWLVVGPLIVLIICETGFTIGLHSWGRVPTLPMIRTYIGQSFELLDALGFPPALVSSALALLVAVALILFSRSVAPIHWVIVVARRTPTRWLLLLLSAACVIISVRLYLFASTPPTKEREPFSLMLFPELGARHGQTRSTRAKMLDVAEAVARANYVTAPSLRKRNIVLIIGDALRADHISANGYFRSTTPYIDWLISSGSARSLTNVVSVCAESSCGLMAIAQSRYAHQFPEKPITLYEVLRLHGYSVRMILGGDHTNFYGLRASFGAVDDYVDGSTAHGYYANDDQLVIDRLQTLPRWDGTPVMMQLHLMSSHVLGRREARFERFRPFVNYARFGKTLSDSSDVERARNFYDNGVLQFDAMVRKSIEALSEKGYLDDAIVVITADHGEMLGEHGVFSHSGAVYQQALEIPLVVAEFGYRSFVDRDFSGLSSQVDIAPTILHELNFPIPPSWSGVALQRERHREYIFFQQGAQVGLFDVAEPGTLWKYWLDLSNGEEFAFQLSHNHSESANSISAVPQESRSRWRLAAMNAGASVAHFELANGK
ncbi:MAG: sulfatase-like hydrolase/transferase [Aromatoleum sp.]|uniref:sulfatase-like hydrolase/transferase n=1 Tax=Aromatoleum sp. TaxID=2307007 RepID=UPI0028939FBD|nr:sulfatase-like hydrolase/transferase [Aromatoleum sp.]MDT3672968.1 sulfatase-like hydrolase/transferase [Aromatoleum sp.]